MSDADMMDAIVAAIFRQSKMHSDAADAPDVWSSRDERLLHIDGAVNIAALARVIRDRR
jgi:hypothetical protein